MHVINARASRRVLLASSVTSGVALVTRRVATETQHRSQPMEVTIRADSGVLTLVNVFAVEPENQPRLVAVLREGTEGLMSKLAGYIDRKSTRLNSSH